MSFGSTRAKHQEVARSHFESLDWSLREARKEQARGRCREAVDYAAQVIHGAGAAMAHVVAQDLPRSKEKMELDRIRAVEDQATELLKSCARS